MIAYADSGFLVSLYAADSNSTEATSLVRSKPVFLLTPLVELEFSNALRLLVFRRQATPAECRAIVDQFALDRRMGVFRSTPLTPEVWEKAVRFSDTHSAAFGTRTLDVLHVATALLLEPDIFFTFDKRQSKLAQAVRLKVAPA